MKKDAFPSIQFEMLHSLNYSFSSYVTLCETSKPDFPLFPIKNGAMSPPSSFSKNPFYKDPYPWVKI